MFKIVLGSRQSKLNLKTLGVKSQVINHDVFISIKLFADQMLFLLVRESTRDGVFHPGRQGVDHGRQIRGSDRFGAEEGRILHTHCGIGLRFM